MSSMNTSNRVRWPLLLGLTLGITIAPHAMAQTDGPGRVVPSQGNAHLLSPGSPHEPYNSQPPTSGPHVRWIANWGVHKIPVPLEVQVHNLEDGGVVIQYRCLTCSELIAQLEALVSHSDVVGMARAMVRHGDETLPRLVVAPYPEMAPPIALTAWGRIETLEKFDEAKILRFIEAYIGIDHHPRQPAP